LNRAISGGAAYAEGLDEEGLSQTPPSLFVPLWAFNQKPYRRPMGANEAQGEAVFYGGIRMAKRQQSISRLNRVEASLADYRGQ
jgi:hypothetical protein